MISPGYTSSGMEEDPNNNNSNGGGVIKREKTAAELRKSNKPLMERKRRERINNCLQQLKSILMEVTKKESSYYSKLEKADILEMTVKYLKNMKRHQLTAAMTKDPSVLGKYIAGFNECTSEVTKYLNGVDGLTSDTRARLLSHLANSLQRTSVSMATSTAVANLQLSMNQPPPPPCAQSVTPLGIQIPAATQLSALPGSITGGGGAGGVCVLSQTTPSSQAAPLQAIPASAMQLVPAKLPTGELVFLLANQQTAALYPQGGAGGVSVVSTVQNNVNNININNPQTHGSSDVTSSVSVISDSSSSAVSPTSTSTLTTQLGVPPGASASVTSTLLLSPGDTLSSPLSSSSGVLSGGASTSGSSPDSDISEASSSCSASLRASVLASREDTPCRRPDRPIPVTQRGPLSCPHDSDTSSESDNNEDDVLNNNNGSSNNNNNNNNINNNVVLNLNHLNMYREESVIRGPMWRPW